MRCPECHERLLGDPERHGARCPYCREPLYRERRRRRRFRPDGQCAVHPDSRAVDTCPRCGNYVCEVCLTPWYYSRLCAACVEFLLERHQTGSEENRAHFQQALRAMILGAVSWGLVVMGLVLAGGGAEIKNIPIVVLGVFLVLPSPIASVLGLGQALAALRVRGDHLILATMGLILSGLHMGAIIGLVALAQLQT